jgi:cytochrome c556
MTRKNLIIAVTIIFYSVFTISYADENTTEGPMMTIMEIMTSIIAPATDTLWAADDPSSDEAWNQLESAALKVIRAGETIKQGGSGTQDNNWANQLDWQSFTNEMTNAAEQALAAIHKKDIDALLDVGDALYQSCVNCHQNYNPAVVNVE